MEIKAHIKEFYIIPSISIITGENILSKDAKKTFNVLWTKYRQIRIAWLHWEKFIDVYIK